MFDHPVLLFDLGGVLVDIAPVPEMLSSLGLAADPPLLARWARVGSWVRFETGEIDPPTFADELVAEFALQLPPEKALLEFEAWNRRMLPGAVELLGELRSRHRLAVLSNTNETHWKRLSGEFGIPELVDFAFASHLIRHRKPDKDAFLHVAGQIGVALEDLVFFDDNQENVDAALSLGMQAHQVEGVEALRKRLEELRLL